MSPVLALAACTGGGSSSGAGNDEPSPSRSTVHQGKAGVENRAGEDPTGPIRDLFKQGLPQNAGGVESSFSPAYDFDQDSCYPAAAITQLGVINPGLNFVGGATGGCREPDGLKRSQLYARSTCNNGWCAVTYGTYFEKDVPSSGGSAITGAGHNHDWEHVITWINQSTNQVEYVSVTAHGSYHTTPRDQVSFEGTHPKVVYHQDGASTHALRLGNGSDEPVENASGAWFHPPLVDWNGFPSTELRDKLMNADFGHAQLDLRDASYASKLAAAKPSDVPLDPNG
ncbi:NPP1 family protein [Streptomyces sp. CWNU-52B]|uniref:NPP1 family protein n=1 Tax=unclassified Streptomyces TaxID=2593676 RepID=UPI0039C2D989